MSYRLLAVHAHPDDESSKGAGTYAAYVDAGVEVMVVSCTGGEAGEVLNAALPARFHAARDLPGLRRVEMAQAQRVLGVEHRWLGYRDSGMAREDGSLEPATFAAIPLATSVRPLVKLIREFRPQVLVTYDENGGYPHPDHIRTHEVSMLAWDLAAQDTAPELGQPWAISKLYYDRTMNSERARTLVEELKLLPDSLHQAERMEEMVERLQQRRLRLTTKIDIGRTMSRRDDALRAHASQVAPDNEFFFGVPRDLEARVYPYEDYELVKTRLGNGELPDAIDAAVETDLFAGIPLTDASDGATAADARGSAAS